MKIEDYLKDKFGYNKEVRYKIDRYITLWRSWYRGYNEDFHHYRLYNGEEPVEMYRKSLQMAKKTCEDWADILFNVNCKFKLEDDYSQKDLQTILNKNNFWLLTNQAVEKSFSVGTGAFVISVKGLKHNEDANIIYTEEAEPTIDFIDVDKIYPLSWLNGKVTECAFVSYRTIHGKTFAVLSAHYLAANGNYMIHNKIFEVNKTGNIVELDKETQSSLLGTFDDFDTKSNKRWFCLISPAIANNIVKSDYEASIPFGISIFANAIDCLKSIDESFDSLSNEITMGRKRIFVYKDMLENIDGQKVFDASDISVYVLPKGFSKDNMLQSENSELRTDEIVDALSAALSAFSNNVGMGKQMYEFSVTNMSTAAQVYSTNSELKRKRDKHKTKLENELFDLIDTLCYVATTFSHYNINPDGLSIVFDDSFFEDISTESERKLREIDSGVAARYEYRTDIIGEDEETARKKVEEIKKENIENIMNLQTAQEGY